MGPYSIKFPGQTGAKELPRSMTVLEAALATGYELSHTCGGKGRCATCEVKIVSGPVADPTHKDYELLFDRVDALQQRLGCQCKIMGQVIVDLPVYVTSIDGVYDGMPGVSVPSDRYRNFRRHRQMEEERDLKNPFYLFRKKYGVTQFMRNQRQERHRIQQEHQGPPGLPGQGRRRPRFHHDFEDLPEEVEARLTGRSTPTNAVETREARPLGPERRDAQRRERRRRGGRRHRHRYGGPSQ